MEFVLFVDNNIRIGLMYWVLAFTFPNTLLWSMFAIRTDGLYYMKLKFFGIYSVFQNPEII